MPGRIRLTALSFTLVLAACAHPPPPAHAPTRKIASSPPLLTGKEIEAFPLRSFRSGDKKQDEAAAIRLFKDIGHRHSEFLSYMELFPEKFRLVDQQTATALTDGAIAKIFASETGRRSLCFLTSVEEKFTPFYLGVSKKMGRELRQVCRPYNKKLSEAEKHMFETMRSKIVPGDPSSQRQKRIVYILSESGPVDIEAYSTRENTTLVFLEPTAFTQAKVVRVLAHEFAISYDQLSRVGQQMNIETWQDGMAVIFGLPLFRGQGNYSTYFKRSANEQAIRCALNDLPVKYALATERAFRFEDKLVAELGLDSLVLGEKNFSCGENVRRWLPAFRAYASVVDFDLGGSVIFLEEHCGEVLDGRPVAKRNDHLRAEVLRQGGKAIGDLPAHKQKEFMNRRQEAFIKDSWEKEKVYERIQKRLIDPTAPERQRFLAERIGTLTGTELEPENGGAPVNLCEFLLEPRVGPRHTGFLGGGPRPRAGGWDTN